MIMVTRLNDSQFAVNPDLIARIHASPDTTLVMVDGVNYIVTETVDEIVEEIARYRARVIALAHDLMDEPAPVRTADERRGKLRAVSTTPRAR